jgi:hypothetical protein
LIGKPIPTKSGNWSARARYALAKKAASMEDLYGRQAADKTSLGVFKPKKIHDLIITPAAPDWKAGFKAALRQARLWENRTRSLEPPRKVPFKFQYKFDCDDQRCNGHKMMIEDWEVGALYWNLVDKGAGSEEAVQKVKHKFLSELCGPTKDTHFFVGTILAHPKSWAVIGIFWPKVQPKVEHVETCGLFGDGLA